MRKKKKPPAAAGRAPLDSQEALKLSIARWVRDEQPGNVTDEDLERSVEEALTTEARRNERTIAGVRVTQALGRTDNNADRFAAKSRAFRDARLKSMSLMSTYFASTQLLSTIAKALTLWYGAHLIGNGALTAGLLIAFLLYLDQFFAPIQQLVP